MLEQFIQRAISAGAIKQTEIRCTRCGTVDHTVMAVGQPATMGGKFTNLAVSIEMQCGCGHTFELNYQNNEFTPVHNPTYVAADYGDDDDDGEYFDDCDDDCGEAGHGNHCNCFEDNTPVRLSTLETPGIGAVQKTRTYNDW